MIGYSFISAFSIWFTYFSIQQSNYDFELPKTWTKDYTITLSHSGGMDGSSTLLTFTFDSCFYVRNSGMNPKKEDKFSLTEDNRKEILKKMRDLRVNKIKSEMSIHTVDDGWSSSLCFGSNCISGGTAFKMDDRDKEIYDLAYGYLEGFAQKKITQ